jgi:hypothetical protein
MGPYQLTAPSHASRKRRSMQGDRIGPPLQEEMTLFLQVGDQLPLCAAWLDSYVA